MVIAGDIGSTWSYLGIYKQDDNKNPVLVFPSDEPKQYARADYRDSLESMIGAFLQEANIKEPIYAACFGISGPPEKNYIIGLDWEISQDRLCDFLVKHSWKKRGCNEAKKQNVVTVVNSMECIDFNKLLESKLLVLNETNTTNDKDKDGLPLKRALIGVRGALGEALVYWGHPPTDPFGDEEYVVSFSEGGHTNFAPSSREEVRFLTYLHKHSEECLDNLELVTYKDVLSIKGIVCMYKFFKDENGGEQNAPDGLEELIGNEDFDSATKKIMIAALKEENTLCVQAIDLFFSDYNAFGGEHF